MGELIRRGSRMFMFLFIMAFTANVSGQTQMSDVVDAFNSGVSLMKINPDAAAASFEKVLVLAKEVGAEADEIKDQASKQIPKMYWESAKSLAGKKDYDGALEKLDACIKSSNDIGDNSQAAKAKSTSLSILNVQGSTALASKDFDAALGYFNEVLKREPRYAKGYLGQVLVYDELKEFDKMEEAASKGLEAARATRDSKTAAAIEKKVQLTFFNNAQEAMANKDYKQVVNFLEKSIEHGYEGSITYYQMGLAQEELQQWNEAVDSFNKAVEIETGGDAEKAKIYFELGKSYQALSNADKACESYKKAMFGDFAEAAKYQIETVLKCAN